MQEFDIINNLLKPLSQGYKPALNLSDDAAILKNPRKNYELVITKDVIAENIHFLKTDPAETIAYKLLGVNLSDLAAMGAKPLYYLMGLQLNKNTSEKWLNDFIYGFKQALKEYGGNLIGGDTIVQEGPIALSLTAIGEVKKNQALLRSQAKIGDLIYVTGTIGDSGLGLKILQNKLNLKPITKKEQTYLVNRYRQPTPRLFIGQKLVKIANSCMDISDGLVADLKHICDESKVGAEIYLSNIPLSKAAIKANPTIEDIISFGDDYELLFTVSPKNINKLKSLKNKTDIQITQIGIITKKSNSNIRFLNKDKIMNITRKGYEHNIT